MLAASSKIVKSFWSSSFTHVNSAIEIFTCIFILYLCLSHISVYVCLHVCVCVCLFVYLHVSCLFLSVYMSVCLSVWWQRKRKLLIVWKNNLINLIACLSVYVYLCLSVCMYACLSVFVYMSVCVSVWWQRKRKLLIVWKNNLINFSFNKLTRYVGLSVRWSVQSSVFPTLLRSVELLVKLPSQSSLATSICHLTQMNTSRLNLSQRPVLDLPTQQGWKAELT